MPPDLPLHRTDPYPEPGTRIGRLRYRSALVLMRSITAVQARTGVDADYILARDFEVDWWSDGGGECRRLVVPAGLVTDLTSVPRGLRLLVERVGPWLEAAILHDYLYVAWQVIPGRGPRPEDRRFADDLMLAAMREARVGRLRAWLIHRAVRLFGGPAYRRLATNPFVRLDRPYFREQLAFVVPARGADAIRPTLTSARRPRRSRPRDGSGPGGAA